MADERYALLFTATAVTATAVTATAVTAGALGWRIGLGGALFFASDTMIAVWDIAERPEPPRPNPWIMSAYILAQYLLASSALGVSRVSRTRVHTYETTVTWTGNRGTGTSGYRDYDRSCDLAAPGRPVIAASSDPLFRGDPARWNPEQLLVASVSQCHLLWFLHLAAEAEVVVTSYVDEAVGTIEERPGGAGRFTEVVLRPRVTVADPAMIEKVESLHDRAHEFCFIAQSVNFPVRHEPVTVAA